MSVPNYSSLNVDDNIPSMTMPPVTRHALAIYCGASGDHNPLHVDIDFARESGLDDVIAHGMLIMAYMGRTLTDWAPQDAIRSFDTRFQAMTLIGDAITTTGTIVEKFDEGKEHCVRVEVTAADQRGEVKALGTAVIALS
ncbi:MAG: acyl dehydratase [Gammaproteobacteria bacterium]|jgi:acyl dehydratase